jgi:transposase
MGHEVIVANARQLRLITHSGNKTDPRDAQTLARLARGGCSGASRQVGESL